MSFFLVKIVMEKKEIIRTLGTALAISFILYGNTIGGNFVYDDQLYNDRQELRDIRHIDDVFTEPYIVNSPEAGIYRPLVTFSFVLNYYLFGDSPVSFRIINIILNGVTAFLIFLVTYKLTGNKRLSYLTFLIFSFLPIHTEAVAFIKSRDEIMSLLFVLLSLLLFLDKRLVWSSVFFLSAVLSKEIAIVTPAIFLYIFTAQNGFKLKEVIKKSAYYIPSLVLFALLRLNALGSYAFGSNETQFIYNPMKFVDFEERISTALKVSYLFVQKLILPVNLSANYYYDTIKIISSPFQSYQSILGIMILAMLVYMTLAKKFRNHIVGIAAIMYLLPYLVVSNLIFASGDIMGERWIYLPSVGFAILLAYPISNLLADKKNKNIGYFIMVLLLLFYGTITINRNTVWTSNINLYQNMLKTAPNSVLTRNNLARLYFSNGYLDKAKEEAQIALNIYPFPPTLDLLGQISWRENNYAQAEKLFKRSIELNPKPIRSYSNLGQMYYEMGKYKEAVDILTYPVDAMPIKKDVLVYALSLIKLKKYNEAIDIIEKNYGDNPTESKLRFALGLAYFKLGNLDKAKSYLDDTKNQSISEEEFFRSLKEF